MSGVYVPAAACGPLFGSTCLLDRAPGHEHWRPFVPLLLGPSRNGVIGEAPALRDRRGAGPDGSVAASHPPALRPARGSLGWCVVNLIELALVGNRAVVAQAAGRLEAEDGRQFSGVGRWPMQIGGLRWTH
jgi:hypothetical protein